jgi:hypothetical protein
MATALMVCKWFEKENIQRYCGMKSFGRIETWNLNTFFR